VAADEVIDVAILIKPRADKLVCAVKLVDGATTLLARVPIGLAVKSGAPHRAASVKLPPWSRSIT
jgi:hypothetical protein